jgi:sporulation protein YlmC with PRC-barrel domain
MAGSIGVGLIGPAQRVDDRSRQEKDMKRIALVSLVTVFLAGNAWSDEKRADEKRDGRALVLKTADILGKQVKNRDGTHLGYLDDLVVTSDGKVVYAALSTRETPVTTGKLFALPVNGFTMSDQNHLVFDADKKLFMESEGFDNERWPTHCDARWLRDKPAATADREATDQKAAKDICRITSINGLSIKNEKGEDLGKIAGFAIDVSNGKTVYAALSYGGVAGVGSKYFAIPWNAMKCMSPNLRVQDKCFVVNATKQDFENATGFEKNNWPVSADTTRFKEYRERNERNEK